MDAKQTPLVDLLRLHADDLHSAHGHNQSSRLLSRAADEVDQLKSNLVALEDEKNSYIDYVGDALGQDHDGETLWDAAQRVLSERDRLRAELAECKRDAERYRWLRERIENDDFLIARASEWCLTSWCEDDPDRYIDAILAAKEE